MSFDGRYELAQGEHALGRSLTLRQLASPCSLDINRRCFLKVGIANDHLHTERVRYRPAVLAQIDTDFRGRAGVLVALGVCLLGGVVLRVGGVLLVAGGLLSTAATGSPSAALLTLLGMVAWLCRSAHPEGRTRR